MSQYIVCRVSKQLFALSILNTSRIISLQEVTKVPDTPSYVMGVLATDGEVLPIVDLPNRFFKQQISTQETAQIIMLYWRGKEVGVTVDEVLSITAFNESQIDQDIEKVTALNPNSSYTAINSVIQSEEGLLLEINPENLFDTTDTLAIEQFMEDYQKIVNEETVGTAKEVNKD